MHSRKKGKSGSKKPVERKKQSWVSYSKEETEKLVVKLANEGKSQSQIGLILRDRYGIPDVRTLTNKKIKQILKENKLVSKIPEDLTDLIKRELDLIKHLEANKKDKTAGRGLILTESKIKRLVKYYKSKNILPKNWIYNRESAKLLIG